MLDDRFQPERFRTTVCNRQHIDTERIFQTGFLVEHIFQVFHVGAAFQFQYDPDSLFRRLVGNVHDIGCLLRLNQRCHVV